MVLKQVAELAIPSDLTCEVVGKKITITGPRGTIRRDFSHTPIELAHIDGVVYTTVWFPRGQQRSLPRTIVAHVQNMITGVTKGYLYKMRLAYAHFPITTNIVDGNTTLEIRNFLREAEVRRVHAIEGVKIEASTAQKDELIISGNDVESVSCTCAKIHDSVKIKNKDLRKFLDGIFVSYKGHISE